ncbi:ferritin light chain-like [Rhinatrema bivittatum]|uniref:ferritin light chain-like n=1 Tax=Rhinatrema bivittatum TaxID=194408 RepID=UPI001126155B|nr:ferritin light chain-like [Rhinatrema bivittatum]
MAEPRGKRRRSSLPSCPAHPSPAGSGVKQNFPPLVEEGLCGVTGALLELSYKLQALAEVFDRSQVTLPRVAKFFWDQAKEEQEAAEAMLKCQRQRGGCYCPQTIQKPSCENVHNVVNALEMALGQWRTVTGYLEELHALSVESSDPHTASTIKKKFIEPKFLKIKLTADLLTNAHRLDCVQDGESNFGEYLIDQLQEELTKA